MQRLRDWIQRSGLDWSHFIGLAGIIAVVLVDLFTGRFLWEW